MRKILLFLLLIILAVGCTMQENELDQVIQELDKMAGELNLIEGLASASNFDGVKHRIISANASLEHINAWIDKAEERGEDPEIINRVRDDSAFLSVEFKTLILVADVVQKLEATRPLMEELERKHMDAVNPAQEYVDEILALIDRIEVSIDEMEQAEQSVIPADKKILDTSGALDKMHNFESEMQVRKTEFSGLKAKLDELKAMIAV